jgi:hypothetical protein
MVRQKRKGPNLSPREAIKTSSKCLAEYRTFDARWAVRYRTANRRGGGEKGRSPRRKPNFRGQTTPELRLGEVEVPPSNFRITA